MIGKLDKKKVSKDLGNMKKSDDFLKGFDSSNWNVSQIGKD